MGKKLNLSHLSESECEQILEVLQKDFEVQKAAKQRVNNVHEELVKEQQRVSLLKSNPKFNDTSCIICLSRFGLFTHRRRKCSKCNLNVCTSCVGQYEDPSGKPKSSAYICHVCSKDKAYRLLSNEWFNTSGKFNSKNFGSSKIARSLFKKASSSLSDTELDSGYQPSSLRSLPSTGARARLDQVFDIDISQKGTDSNFGDDEAGIDDTSFLTLHEEKEDGGSEGSDSSFEDELSPRSTTPSYATGPPPPRPIQKATSLDKLFFASRDAAFSLPPRPVPGESTPLSGRSRQNSVSGSGDFTSSQNHYHHHQRPHNTSSHNISGSTSGLATPTGSQTPALEHSYERRAPTPEFTRSLGRSRPKTLEEFRPSARRSGEASGLYKEALDGARRSEEFKFRVKFDQLLVDLHLAVDEKSPNGLSNSFASPSYGEVMLLFRDRVKELLKGFSKRLQLAYDSFSNIDDPELTLENVKSDISHFVEDLIGESLELTSDEAVSDLSSVSGDSPQNNQTLFEELLAQAIISKLLENHRREVSKSLNKSDSNISDTEKLLESVRSTNSNSNITISISSVSSNAGSRRYISNNTSGRNSQDYVDGELTGSNRYTKKKRHRKDSIESLFSNKSELIPDYDTDENDEDDNDDDDAVFKGRKGKHGDSLTGNDYDEDKVEDAADKTLVGEALDCVDGLDNHNTKTNEINKEFEELRELVHKSQGRPKVEAHVIEEIIEEEEVEEEEIAQVTVNREEASKDVDSRFSVLDKVFNPEPALPDFSQFENIDFNSDEIDPDLLAMNLAIIPEETEEELQEDEESEEGSEDGVGGGRAGRGWRGNWIFKGKDGSTLPNKQKTIAAKSEHPFLMTIPDPEHNVNARIGNKDADQLSDFSDSELFASDEERSDEEESSFYPNTSKELARISRKHRHGHHHKGSKKGSLFKSDASDDSEDEEGGKKKKGSLDEGEDIPDVPGPIIEPPKQELKLLTDLVPAENDDPRFVVVPESVTVMEGEPVKFNCQVEGTPPIDVFWYREGAEVEELEDSEDVELSSDGDKHTAVLYNIGHSMAGQYMCIALSESGKAIQYLVVSVKDNKQELKAPEFLKSIGDVEVTEGQSVKFRVKVKGFPPPRINWYKDGALLRSSKGCRIEKFGNRDYILTIDYATMDDDAEYTVSARNVAGEIRSTAQVLVEPQSDMPPRKQKLLSDSDSSDAKATSAKNNNNNKDAISATFASSSLFASPPPAAPSSSSSSPSLRSRQEAQQVNQLDRRMTMTQKAIDEEQNKMEKDAAKLSNINCSLDGLDLRLASLESSLPSFASFSSEWALNNSMLLDDDGSSKGLGVDSPRLMSTINLELLRTAEEVMQREKNDAALNLSTDKSNSFSATGPKFNDNQNGSADLDLPDHLDKLPPPPPKPTYSRTKQPTPMEAYNNDDFARISRKKRAPEKYTSEVSIASFNTSLTFIDPDVNPNNISAGVDEILSQTTNDSLNLELEHDQNNVSFDSGKEQSVLDNSVSSVSSGGGAGSGAMATSDMTNIGDAMMDPVKRHEQYKEFHTKDYEVHKKQEKKKWSVNLQPFVPKAEIVNRSLDEDDDKASMLGIHIPADFSPDSSQHSSRGDDNDNNSSQSSPRQSVDSGVYVTSSSRHRQQQREREERPEPVRMFGHTSEAEVPESRTEFNTDDGNFDLPSVNRLKAMFGGPAGSNSSSSSSSSLSSPSRSSKSGDSKILSSMTRDRALTSQSTPPPSPSAPSSTTTTSSLSVEVQQQPMSMESIQPSRSSVVLQMSPSPSSPSNSSNNNDTKIENNNNFSNNDNTINNNNVVDKTDNSYLARKQRQREGKSKQNRNSLPPDMYFDFDLGKEPVLIYPEPNPHPIPSLPSLPPPTAPNPAQSHPQATFSPAMENIVVEEIQQQQQQQPQQQQLEKQQLQESFEKSQPQLQVDIEDDNNNNNNNDASSSTTAESFQQSFEELQIFEPEPAQNKPAVQVTTTTPRSSQQPKLVVKQATIEDGTSDAAGGNVPRIKSGCISARAAFWERRMMEGPSDVDSDEFPEMVERTSTASTTSDQE